MEGSLLKPTSAPNNQTLDKFTWVLDAVDNKNETPEDMPDLVDPVDVLPAQYVVKDVPARQQQPLKKTRGQDKPLVCYESIAGV